jgi:hypothetical protein
MLIGSGLSFQSYMSVSFAPVGAAESTLEPRRLGYIGRRLRPLLISEEGPKIGGGVCVMDEQAKAGRVLQMRLVVEAPDYEQAVAFYRDVLGPLEAGESSAVGCVRGD